PVPSGALRGADPGIRRATKERRPHRLWGDSVPCAAVRTGSDLDPAAFRTAGAHRARFSTLDPAWGPGDRFGSAAAAVLRFEPGARTCDRRCSAGCGDVCATDCAAVLGDR